MIVYFNKNKHGLGSVQTINFENYKQYINKIGISKLPEALLKGHQFLSKNTNQYNSNESIRETILDYLRDLNNYVSKLPSAKQKAIFNEDKGYSGNKFTGSKYKLTKNLKTSEIAKLIKKELEIEFEGIAKFSVSSEVYTGGSAISVKILDVTFNPFTPEFTKALSQGLTIDAFNEQNKLPNNRYPKRVNEQFEDLIKKVEKITNQYNFDDSDSQTDYFHVNYYDRIGFDEGNYLMLHYPKSPDAIKRKEWLDTIKAEKEKSSQKASERKGKFKKGEIVFYAADMHPSWHKFKLDNGFYLAQILKSPNGRGLFNQYTIYILEDIKLLSENTINYHKKNGYEKYYVKNQFGTFYKSSPINGYEDNMLPLTADKKILAINKAKLLAINLLKQK